jgi:predicted Zn finger-like uncharacterized protein
MIIYKLTCPSCGSHLKTSKPVPAGKVVKCPKCRQRFPAPAVAVNVPAAEAEPANTKKGKPALVWGMVGGVTLVLGMGLGISWTKLNWMSQSPPTIAAESDLAKTDEPAPPKDSSNVEISKVSPETTVAKVEPAAKSVKEEPKQKEDRPKPAAVPPVANPASKDAEPPAKDDAIKVLVSGKPPLTQDFLDQLIAYGQWMLDLQLTEPQRQQWQQLFVEGWKKADQATKDNFWTYAEYQLKQFKEIAKLTDRQRSDFRAQKQPLFLASLRQAPGPENRLLLDIYESAHKPGSERNPILVAGTPPLTQDTANSWRIFMEWILDVNLTEPQRQEFQRLFVNDWKKMDQTAKNDSLKTSAEGLPSQLGGLSNYDNHLLRAQAQSQYLAALRNSGNELSRWLLAVHDSVHKPGGKGNQVLEPGNPSLTQSMVSQYGDFIEWVLALRLSDGLTELQRQDLKEVVMKDWQIMDKSGKHSFLGLLKKWNEITRASDADRAHSLEELQPKFLTRLRSELDHEPSRWLLRVYDQEQDLVKLVTDLQSQIDRKRKHANGRLVIEGSGESRPRDR